MGFAAPFLPQHKIGVSEGYTSMNGPIRASVYIEKITGCGEDAEPLLWVNDSYGLLAVFDGMGGAGSTPYEEEGVRRTGAYLASRTARDVFSKCVHHFVSQGGYNADEFINTLKEHLQERLKAKLGQFQTTSLLKSSLIRQLPTTAAAILFKQGDRQNNKVEYQVIWAGDSRAFIMHPQKGLIQLTQDNLRSNNDPMENLINDSPLSNYINADVDFTLYHKQFSTPQPIIFLVSTDGGFGFLPTPMHFENLLLECLLKASTPQHWEDQLHNRLMKIAGDDVALAMMGVGWSSFDSLKGGFTQRYFDLKDRYINPLDRAEDTLQQRQDQLKQSQEQREVSRRQLWDNYKQTYLSSPDYNTSDNL